MLWTEVAINYYYGANNKKLFSISEGKNLICKTSSDKSVAVIHMSFHVQHHVINTFLICHAVIT